MQVQSMVGEIRCTDPIIYVKADRHFFYDGTVYQGGTGKGNFDKGVARSGALHGSVKVMRLKYKGRYSLRSIGTGEGTLHVSGTTKVLIDGQEYTVDEFYDKNR